MKKKGGKNETKNESLEMIFKQGGKKDRGFAFFNQLLLLLLFFFPKDERIERKQNGNKDDTYFES